MNKNKYDEVIAFHPGYYVKRYIVEKKMTYQDFAEKLQTTPEVVDDLVHERIVLTDEMALQLSLFFGTSTFLPCKS